MGCDYCWPGNCVGRNCPEGEEATVSHDRGCHCGKEPYEYSDCRDRECSRSPVYDAVYHAQQACKRLGTRYIPGVSPMKCPSLTIKIEPRKPYVRRHEEAGNNPVAQFVPKIPAQVVKLADWTGTHGSAKRIIVSQEGGGRGEVVPGNSDVEIAGPCRVRIARGRLELVVNHDVPIRWTAAGRKGKRASSNGDAKR